MCSGFRLRPAKLETVRFFLLKELDSFDAILSQPAIEFAAIDSKRRRCPHLITSELLQHRKNVALFNFGKWDSIVHVSLEH